MVGSGTGAVLNPPPLNEYGSGEDDRAPQDVGDVGQVPDSVHGLVGATNGLRLASSGPMYCQLALGLKK